MSTAIEFENISKQYRLGLVSTRTLSHDLNRWWKMNIMRQEDPYLKIGSVNDRAAKADSEYVWALNDINFKVEQGDVVGIIGKNGAGKSTLLKILSKVTTPTTGTIRAKGRIASLLEVGTGFHPEMTGRENIFMNGAIMGMTKAEIFRKFDAIVDFAGVERYIDTPVKRYSSGMMVRLGFAVAAFLEPEILVVDEVLAVGDAEFQKKAIGKMQDVSKGEGRTVLFVSHNMDSVRKLCNNAILLKDGHIDFLGNVDSVVEYYVNNNITHLNDFVEINNSYRRWDTSKDIELISAKLLGLPNEYATNQPLEFEVVMKKNRKSVKSASLEIMINNQFDVRIGSFISDFILLDNILGTFKIKASIFNHNLAKGRYQVCFNVGLKDVSVGLKDYDVVYNVLAFEIQYNDSNKKDPIVLWPPNWGSNHFQGKIELL